MEGWEPAEYTRYEYDSEGRLLQSVTLREPEFTEDDVTDLLALRMVQRETGRYGEDLLEAMSKAADPNYYGPGAVRFIPHHRVNHAEAAVEQYRKENDLPAGAEVFVERKQY